MELELKGLMEEAKKKFLETGEVSKDLTNKYELLKKEMGDKFSAIEERLSKSPVEDNTNNVKTVGEIFIGSTNFKNFSTSGFQTTGAVNVGSFGTKAIVNATGASQPLVAADRTVGIYANPDRKLTVRDLLPTMTTTSNSVEYTKENVFTNSAAPQYVSPSFENVAKAESDITFTLGTAPVRTIAHFISASRQVLEDSGALEGYINSRLVYGLKLKEENQLLNGDGTGGNLSGLITNATAYDTALTVSGDTYMDKLRHGIYQVEAAEYPVDAIIMNPKDWHTIELIKDSGATTGMYVFGNPLSGNRPNIWGVPVVTTNSMAVGKFLVGSYTMGAAIFDRQNATVEMSNSHGDNFTKNMVTILAEERIALAIFRPASLVYGSF
jgi:HK97 family phage major capsid protein